MAASVKPLAGLRAAVVGGSIGGLAAATALHRLGASVRVYEKSASIGTGGSLGFCHVPLWEHLKGARMMRRGVQASRAQGAFLYKDLWRFWYDALPNDAVQFGAEVSSLGDDPRAPAIDGERFDVVVVADGGWSALRAKYFDAAQPQYAGYEVWRFRVDLGAAPPTFEEGEWRSTEGGPFATIQMHIAADDGHEWIMGGTTVAKPLAELERPPPAPGASRQVEAGSASEPPLPDWFLPFYRRHFGRINRGGVYETMAAAAAHGKITPLAQYEFAASRVVAGRCVLVGDAAHMASPRTASGAHTAVLDAAALYEAFGAAAAAGGAPADIVDRALAAYAGPGVERAAALYARSREVSAPVAVPGWQYREAAAPAPRGAEL